MRAFGLPNNRCASAVGMAGPYGLVFRFFAGRVFFRILRNRGLVLHRIGALNGHNRLYGLGCCGGGLSIGLFGVVRLLCRIRLILSACDRRGGHSVRLRSGTGLFCSIRLILSARDRRGGHSVRLRSGTGLFC